MRIRHVIPTVGRSAPAELVEAQNLTLRSIERALRCVDPGIEVEVRAVHFPDEPLDCDWVAEGPHLSRSTLDLGEFAVRRRLPIQSDVLAGFGDSSEFDLAVLTNVDIALQPMFYELVGEIAADGHDAFSITRRTVQPRFRGSSLARLSATVGATHPGSDCFGMVASVVDRLLPCDVALGVRWVGHALVWQLQLVAENFRNMADLHATFHVGDDRIWSDPRLEDYERFNEAQVTDLLRRLAENHGRAAAERLPGARAFLESIDTGDPPRPPSGRRTELPYRARPYASSLPKLIFSANSGRAGSQYLAELLDSSPRIDAGHERPPQMVGEYTRRVAYEPRMSSYGDRLVKADALRVALRRVPAASYYADTSHMFLKTMADVVFDEFQHELITVIVLRRDPIAVAKSFFELDMLGPRRRTWHDFLIPPTAPYSAFPIDPSDVDDQFDLIFGYLADIENRTEWYRRRAPGARWIDVRLEDLATVEGARALFVQLGTPPPPDLLGVVERRVNLKERPKAAVGQPVTLDRVRRRLGEFLRRHEGRPDLEPFLHAHGSEW